MVCEFELVAKHRCFPWMLECRGVLTRVTLAAANYVVFCSLLAIIRNSGTMLKGGARWGKYSLPYKGSTSS